MSKNTTNIDDKVKNNWLIVLIVIWAMVLITILSTHVLAHFLCLIFHNINRRIAYVLIASCLLIIITIIICLTIIICKCLSTRDKSNNPYQAALTNMLTSSNKKENSSNSGSPSTPIAPANPTSPATQTDPTTPTK